MDRSDVDNPSPSCLLHIGKRIFAEIKCSTQIKRNNGLPFLIREVDTFIDVLHSCIVDKHINSSKFAQSFSYDFFTIGRFGQISKNIDRLSVRIFSLEFINCFFDLFIRSKTIEDNIVSPSSQWMSNSQPYSTEWSSYQSHFIVTPEYWQMYCATRDFSRLFNLCISKNIYDIIDMHPTIYE